MAKHSDMRKIRYKQHGATMEFFMTVPWLLHLEAGTSCQLLLIQKKAVMKVHEFLIH